MRNDISVVKPSRHRISRRLVTAAIALAAAIGTPVAVAATSSPAGSASQVVHTQVLRSGAVIVSGYDGGAALDPSGR